MARVAAPGAHFSASGFASPGDRTTGLRGWLHRRLALHFVPLAALEPQLAAAGFAAVGTRMTGPAVGYAWGVRSSGGSTRR
jgi:hypothetical protein